MKMEQFMKLNEKGKERAINSANFAKLVPGFDSSHNSSVLVEYVSEFTIYLKTMSDHGVTDEANGKAIQDFLKSKTIWFQSDRARSLVMLIDDYLKAFTE